MRQKAPQGTSANDVAGAYLKTIFKKTDGYIPRRAEFTITPTIHQPLMERTI